MEKNEFKTKVLYGSAEDLILYKNKGIIDPYAMVAEFSFSSKNILNAFIVGTIDMGGYDQYVILERKDTMNRIELKILFGDNGVKRFKDTGITDFGTIWNFTFNNKAEVCAFFQGLNLAVTFSYTEIIK